MEKVPQNILWPENLFKTNDIVAVGEFHGKCDDAIISFIEKFSSQLKGVLYEEPVNLQPSIDLYMSTGNVSEELESHFVGAEKEGNYIRGKLKIFDKLKEHKMQVICIDSSKVPTEEYKNKSKQGYYFLRGQSRDEDMFNNAMAQYQARPGKYLIVCGANHIAEGKHVRSNEDTLGMRLKSALHEKSQTIDLRTLSYS